MSKKSILKEHLMLKRIDASDYLKTEEDIASYLNEFKNDCEELKQIALRYANQAREKMVKKTS